MPFLRPTLKEISTQIQTDLWMKLREEVPLQKHSVLYVLGQVLAGATHLLHGHLDFLSRQLFPDTAEGPYLERWASIWGVRRAMATSSQGKVRLTGLPHTLIPKETELTYQGEIFFQTEGEGVLLPDGTLEVSCQCKTPGKIGNLPASETLTLVSPRVGVNSQAIVLPSGFLGGTEKESDPELLKKLLFRIQNPPSGGTKTDYEIWTREVEGVGRVWVYPNLFGVGTVGVAYLMRLLEAPLPSEQHFKQVELHLNERKPLGAQVKAFLPKLVPIPITLSLTPLSLERKPIFIQKLKELFHQEANLGETFPIYKITKALAKTTLFEEFELCSPKEDLKFQPDEIPILGEITWI